MWGFLEIRDTFLGVAMVRIIMFWGLYWGSPNFGKLPCRARGMRLQGREPWD